MYRFLFFISVLLLPILSYSKIIFTSTSSTHSVWSSRKHEYVAKHTKKKLVRINFSLDTIFIKDRYYKVVANPLRLDLNGLKVVSVHCVDKHKRECTFSIYSYDSGCVSITVYYLHNLINYEIDPNILQ